MKYGVGFEPMCEAAWTEAKLRVKSLRSMKFPVVWPASRACFLNRRNLTPRNAGNDPNENRFPVT